MNERKHNSKDGIQRYRVKRVATNLRKPLVSLRCTSNGCWAITKTEIKMNLTENISAYIGRVSIIAKDTQAEKID